MADLILPAHTSERWIKCPPSAQLCTKFDTKLAEYCEDDVLVGYRRYSSKEILEGKECHRLAAYLLRKAFGQDDTNPINGLTCYTREMHEYAENYCKFIMCRVQELLQQGANPVVAIEECVDYSLYTGVSNSVGIADCFIAGQGVLDVVDLKYGRGTTVSAEQNPQLMIYALGALELVRDRYNISEIRLIIYQPRRDNIHTHSMSIEGLLEWARNVLYPAAQQAHNGDGEFCVGDHCRFCAVKAICRARAEHNLALSDYVREISNGALATLTTDEIACVLNRGHAFVTWFHDITAWATAQLKSGLNIPGFKLGISRNKRRQYTNEDAVARIVQDAGYNPYKTVLLSPVEMTQLLGKNQFERLVGQYVRMPQGNAILVADIDNKRPAISSAAEDFGQFSQLY